VHDLARRLEIDAAAEIVAAEPHHRDSEPEFAEITLFHRRAFSAAKRFRCARADSIGL
jgi:hypothetical protein